VIAVVAGGWIGGPTRSEAVQAPTIQSSASAAPAIAGIYGAALNVDTKANLEVGWTNRARLAHRFRASSTSTIRSVRFAQRGGPGYSGGSGGTLRISIQGEANGIPSGSDIGSGTYSPGNPRSSWATFDAVTLSANVVAGQLYDVVFQNIDPDPVANYISINELFVYGPVLHPRQPAFSDDDAAVLYATSGKWVVQDNFTADMDVAYADGTHDGTAYIQNMTDFYGRISGPASVRERFTVSGGDRTASSASVRVRRSIGSDPLVISILEGDAVIASGSVPAAEISQSAPGLDTGGAVWASVTFPPVVLRSGASYDLELTTTSRSAYTASPIREGTDVGLRSDAFRDGSAESSLDGSRWSELYRPSPTDLQFYVR
jgi:hypothetical protein